MLITMRMLIFGVWAIEILAFFVVIPAAVIAALRSSLDEIVYWRTVKIASAFLGLVGFFLLLLNFEQLVRGSLVQEGREYELQNFLEAKFAINHAMSEVCSKNIEDEQTRTACSDLVRLDARVSFQLFQSPIGLTEFKNWQGSPQLNVLINQVNTYIEAINRTKEAFGAAPIFSFDTRLTIALFSTLLVLLSIAGSLGEAIFQYRQAASAGQAI
jgi:hypothetical protein